ncbi:hypothetical protein SAMN05421503_1412 [Terribacillus aidingensis]|uniref:Uncharacterized protein n=1 Tax=Terribacillus aidingensis TaxID=586416 RepID=A0A285NLS6_9BACI|nr:hypothetical protein [Terribacillus aidingensis]SNZ09907.1 hypothetical protein SAMN05421503_1412 [Terribacillus aidingensis]
MAVLKIHDDETDSWIMVRTGAVSDEEETIHLDIDDFIKMINDIATLSSSLTSLKTQSDNNKITITNHAESKDNPHATTKAQVGLANVDNVQQASKSEFEAHTGSTNNPHGVTKSQVGLSNVDNTKQATKIDFDNHISNTDIHWTKEQRDELVAKLANLEARLAVLEQPDQPESGDTAPPTT